MIFTFFKKETDRLNAIALRSLSKHHAVGCINPDGMIDHYLRSNGRQLYNYHRIGSVKELRRLLVGIKDSIYDALIREDEELAKVIVPKEMFKLNDQIFLDWQKKQRKFVRPAFAFTDSYRHRKTFKEFGFIVGKPNDIMVLAQKINTEGGEYHGRLS
jgi:hypothetical protein